MTDRRGRGRPKDTETDTDTSAAIARAAVLRFADKGYEAASLREIASDAKVDVALISYRFGGKKGLWKAIVSKAALDLLAVLDRALKDVSDANPRDRLRHAMKAYLAHLLAWPEVPRLLLRDITVDSERSHFLLEELSQPLHEFFVALAQAALAECNGEVSHLQFRIADFIYSSASKVARRDRLAKLVAGMEDDATFEAALHDTLIDGALRCG